MEEPRAICGKHVLKTDRHTINIRVLKTFLFAYINDLRILVYLYMVEKWIQTPPPHDLRAYIRRSVSFMAHRAKQFKRPWNVPLTLSEITEFTNLI